MAEQSFKNHSRYVPGYHFVTTGLLALYLFYTAHFIWPLNQRGLHEFLLGIALILLAWYARAFPVGVQDRVIRLEERLRVRELAPALAARFDALPIQQVTALRFASDAEFPALLQQVLDGKLTEPKAIKAAIQHWRADNQRI